jgi:hypothetical protein
VPSEAPKEQWSGQVDAQGLWKTPPLSSDTYEVQIRDERSAWLTESLEVEPGEPDLHLRIDLVEIAGLLRLGREPLAAEIGLSRERSFLRFESDEEGLFAGFLPEAGDWGVVVKDPASGLSLALEEPVEVRVPKGIGAPRSRSSSPTPGSPARSWTRRESPCRRRRSGLSPANAGVNPPRSRPARTAASSFRSPATLLASLSW